MTDKPPTRAHVTELSRSLQAELNLANAECDKLSSLVGAAITRASLAPGERATSPAHALTAAVDELRARAERAEKQARLTHAEYLQAAPEERAMMEAGTADPLDVLREMHQRTVAELRARAERAERELSETRDRMTETIWLVAEAFGADRDALCCAKVVRHMDRRELGTRCLHGRIGDARALSNSPEVLAAHGLKSGESVVTRAPSPEPQPEDAPLDCPFEHLGPCDAGDRGHHTHTVDGVVYAGAPSDVASKACDCPGGLLEHLFGCEGDR